MKKGRRSGRKIKLPVCKDSITSFPKVAKCPWCKLRKIWEPHSMAILGGGALLMDRKSQSSIHDDRQIGFLHLTWHGAHGQGVGGDRDMYKVVEIANDCRGGQFDLYFCSTACLRAFLNSCVDALELEVQKEKRKTPRQLAADERAADAEIARLTAEGVFEIRDPDPSS